MNVYHKQEVYMIKNNTELSANSIDDALTDAGIIHAERLINGVSLIITELKVLDIVGNTPISIRLTPISPK